MVLLEFLIKNGTERVVDDARSHASMIKVLRNFYYIDDKGKDEGLNGENYEQPIYCKCTLTLSSVVRNRAKEIVELLSSTDKIRSERKLAKKNRNKYVGVGSDSMSRGYGSPSSSRYAGFGSDSGGGLSFNGDAMTYGESAYPRPSGVGKYDMDDDDSDSNNSSSAQKATTAKEDNLFGDDDEFESSNKKSNTTNDDDWGDFAWGGSVEEPASSKPSVSIDDDFADFQHAVVEEPLSAPSKPKKQDIFDLLGEDNITSSTNTTTTSSTKQFDLFNSQPITPSGYQQSQLQQPHPQQRKEQFIIEENVTPPVSTPTGMWAQASNFVSLDSLGKNAASSTPSNGPSMNSLKSTSVQASWNNWASNNQQQAPKPANKPTSAFDDLLF